MAHWGSVFSTSSKVFCEARYQNECWYSMPRSNSFCASGVHDVSKCTLPSLLSSVCPRVAVRASETPVAATAATANEVLFMILLLVGIKPNSARSSLGLEGELAILDPTGPGEWRSRGHDTLRWRSECGTCHTHTRFPTVRGQVFYRRKACPRLVTAPKRRAHEACARSAPQAACS